MKKLLLILCMLGTGSLSFAQAPSLGSSASFGVLGSSTVTNTGASVVTGDLGVNPPGVSATGFLLSNHIVTGPGGGVTAGLGSVTGTIFVADSVALLAHADAIKAYAALAAMPCLPANDLSTRGDLGTSVAVLPPGVYCFKSSAQLTGQLTLDGNGVYVFQIGSTLTTATNSSVVLTNGAQCGNVFWQVGSSATLGTGTAFAGNLIAFTSDTVTHGVNVAGRIFALGGAVTLDTNNITVAGCSSAGGSGGGGNGGGDDDNHTCKNDKDEHDKDHHPKDKDHRDKDRKDRD